MMTFKVTEAYVWIWLPGKTNPVVAGVLKQSQNQILFNYGQSYLAKNNAMPIFEPELPLRSGAIPLIAGLSMPSCIRDASPDAWGRRIIAYKKTGFKSIHSPENQLDELTYLLDSNSDRLGALDFQHSPDQYIERKNNNATLRELLKATALVEEGLPLSQILDQVLLHGSSLGGARPKAMLDGAEEKWIAKFPSRSDNYNVIKAEFIAMRMAKKLGINVAEVLLEKVSKKDVLLVKRFDRTPSPQGWTRHAVVSALTILELDEMMARYASYEDLAEIIRKRFSNPQQNLKELFCRIIFNILCGNTDDHAKNHAAFWDGTNLNLTPAYDICPQGRTGGEASQAMLIHKSNRMSQISVCKSAAAVFQLSSQQAQEIIENYIDGINQYWPEICDEAELSTIERSFLLRRQFLNPYAFE